MQCQLILAPRPATSFFELVNLRVTRFLLVANLMSEQFTPAAL